MGFIKRLFGFESKLIKLLSVRIVTDEVGNYYVSFTQHHEQLKQPEFVRIILHYYSKILFYFVPSDPEMKKAAGVLNLMMRDVLDEGIQKKADVLYNAGIDDIATIVSSEPERQSKAIEATLYFVDTMRRHITTSIPRNVYSRHLAISVLVLIQAIINELDQEWIDILNQSLLNMKAAYKSGQSYSKMKNIASIPTAAYLAALSGD